MKNNRSRAFLYNIHNFLQVLGVLCNSASFQVKPYTDNKISEVRTNLRSRI